MMKATYRQGGTNHAGLPTRTALKTTEKEASKATYRQGGTNHAGLPIRTALKTNDKEASTATYRLVALLHKK